MAYSQCIHGALLNYRHQGYIKNRLIANMITHKVTKKPSLFTLACFFRGETVYVLEAAEHDDWSRKLAVYRTAHKKNKHNKINSDERGVMQDCL